MGAAVEEVVGLAVGVGVEYVGSAVEVTLKTPL